MENTITANEIKRRGISAVDDALLKGPVHVIQRNRPRYVIPQGGRGLPERQSLSICRRRGPRYGTY